MNNNESNKPYQDAPLISLIPITCRGVNPIDVSFDMEVKESHAVPDDEETTKG